MRILSATLAIALLAGCGPAEQPAADSAVMAPAPVAALTLADFAGTWQNTATIVGTENPVPSTLTGSADGSTWTTTLEGRPAIPTTAMLVGDSLITQTEEYESVLRKGVMVSVRTAAVMRDGMMMGNMVATYKTPAGEEKVNGTIQGTRAP
ncbi:MAG: hypothetical protein ABIZ91_05620 [Gemmatimonadaceae bacterium]